MTNREKFKEVFGYDLKEDDEPCIATFTDMPFDCAARTCCDCQMVNFWDEEYQKPIDLSSWRYKKCRDCKYLTNEKTVAGYLCKRPNWFWRGDFSMYKQRSGPACRAFEPKE